MTFILEVFLHEGGYYLYSFGSYKEAKAAYEEEKRDKVGITLRLIQSEAIPNG